MSDQRLFIAALLDPDAPCPAGLTAWNGSDPARRFAVYRNNVVVSLIDALADTFPVTLELVGEEFFRAMAGVFIRAAPPSSVLLAEYGAGFPAFIERFEPTRSVPYLADVARLELLRVRAFHAADADPVTPGQVARALADPERLPALRATCHPSLGVLCSRYAIVSLWAAHQGIGDLAHVDPAVPETALVVRTGLEVQVLSLPPGGDVLVRGLASGLPLGDATARAASVHADFDLTASFALLLRYSALCSLS
ncbi:MAG: DNA-binding domain-containing protein [Candidatus Contendobacter sp.]